jgi:hypothetical protein
LHRAPLPVLGSIAIASVVGFAWLLGTRSPSHVEVSDEPRSPKEQLASAPVVARAAVSPSPSAPTASSSVPVDGKSVAKPRAARSTDRWEPASPPSLTREVAMLDEVRRELARGDGARALSSLDDYERSGARTLSDEAAVLRIEALVATGRTGEARRVAERFIERNPNSALADRARTLVQLEGEGGGS